MACAENQGGGVAAAHAESAHLSSRGNADPAAVMWLLTNKIQKNVTQPQQLVIQTAYPRYNFSILCRIAQNEACVQSWCVLHASCYEQCLQCLFAFVRIVSCRVSKLKYGLHSDPFNHPIHLQSESNHQRSVLQPHAATHFSFQGPLHATADLHSDHLRL